MSKEEDKFIHSKRIHDTEKKVKRRICIAKDSGYTENDKVLKQEHRLAKHNAVNCGNSNCFMCGNPRKFFNEPTIQEKRFNQTEGWDG